MLTEVGEVVEVVAVFERTRVVPTVVKWNSAVYKIQSVSMVRSIFDGQTRVYFFDVSDALNHFNLSFNTGTLKWRLEQIYSDG